MTAKTTAKPRMLTRLMLSCCLRPSLTQLQPGSVFAVNSVVEIAPRAHTEAQSLGQSLPEWSRGWGGGTPQQGPYRHGWPVLPPQGVIWFQAAAKNHIWVCGSVAAKVPIYIGDSGYHLRSWRSPESNQAPEFGVGIWGPGCSCVWVVCAATQWHSSI